MAHDKQTGLRAQAKQEKAILVIGVLLIEELNGKLVVKHSLSLRKGDAVFLEVCSRLGSVSTQT